MSQRFLCPGPALPCFLMVTPDRTLLTCSMWLWLRLFSGIPTQEADRPVKLLMDVFHWSLQISVFSHLASWTWVNCTNWVSVAFSSLSASAENRREAGRKVGVYAWMSHQSYARAEGGCCSSDVALHDCSCRWGHVSKLKTPSIVTCGSPVLVTLCNFFFLTFCWRWTRKHCWGSLEIKF